MREPVIFEKSKQGRRGCYLPPCDVPSQPLEELMPRDYLRDKKAEFPEVAEIDVVRHFTRLSTYNYGVDTGFYPLGSCTMKYNPKVNEELSRLSGFAKLHPYQPEEMLQGALELMYNLERDLANIAGMARVSLQPAAGAHGELAGIMIIKAYHEKRGETKRDKVIVPDSAHGTNPATAAVAGYKTVEVPSNSRGEVDLEALEKVLDDTTAALMLTNPNTLGIFESQIIQIAEMVHKAGGLLYYDGANINAVMGYARPGDMGFDVVHFNLHKTFSTPHGGGGPGSGPVGVMDYLEEFLPVPTVEKREDGTYYLDSDRNNSIGRIKGFYGNFLVMIKAYCYIKALGSSGLKEASESAVLNANYLMEHLKKTYHLPYDRTCKHEFVINSKTVKSQGVHTVDIAKRLLDYGYHPPTVYFPLIVEEAIMIEPTETESKETLDEFIQVMERIHEEALTNKELLLNAPQKTLVRRLDEVSAARNPVIRWRRDE
ncbi:aminomethyl-transferring glycine dehydrogenase subunit GcvPB [Desulfitibacter alkalitolerans]|uniref:aminomethyl-transferring glycine dehydrogenase subunit GcvPB n=1 Tax=Desulfitibacter alkalitolerans TaxID=264641 RepID=UPI00048513FD|nr:aminomethyl-transferring glycine dehydrogenase subunit GcvPB [Desulfitibacter alkalitolerans]